MMNYLRLPAFALIFLVFGCAPNEKNTSDTPMEPVKGQFGYDLNFLKRYQKDLILLEDGESKVILSPAYQGRVMTSSASGLSGTSYGWINHELIASGNLEKHMNAFGGEERFWLGPEGGQFSIYFKKGVPFTFDNWFVPKELDTEPFATVSSSKTEARFEKVMNLENYSGNVFNMKVNRNIKLLSRDSLSKIFNADFPSDVKVLGFESENILTNTGKTAWTKKTGALSVWVLSMFNASDSARVAIPFKQGPESELGKIVTDNYFGNIPPDRLQIRDGFMVFRADAKYRSKLGISPQRAMPLVCSYDGEKQVLTIAQFSLPQDESEYVNSLWEVQKDPFAGDAVNSYNDGPNESGGQLGKFYEIESSSPAAFLKPGESITHVHRTVHFEGPKESLDAIVYKIMKLHLSDIALK
jgi:hypothetical protein